mmetsp:Transcript_20792/g.62233  ORF Transcript_20792/g.62233 Transcript_20792/m.62233 type:complete len:368 (+) Transcript_20792:499-1602(+)
MGRVEALVRPLVADLASGKHVPSLLLVARARVQEQAHAHIGVLVHGDPHAHVLRRAAQKAGPAQGPLLGRRAVAGARRQGRVLREVGPADVEAIAVGASDDRPVGPEVPRVWLGAGAGPDGRLRVRPHGVRIAVLLHQALAAQPVFDRAIGLAQELHLQEQRRVVGIHTIVDPQMVGLGPHRRVRVPARERQALGAADDVDDAARRGDLPLLVSVGLANVQPQLRPASILVLLVPGAAEDLQAFEHLPVLGTDADDEAVFFGQPQAVGDDVLVLAQAQGDRAALLHVAHPLDVYAPHRLLVLDEAALDKLEGGRDGRVAGTEDERRRLQGILRDGGNRALAAHFVPQDPVLEVLPMLVRALRLQTGP